MLVRPRRTKSAEVSRSKSGKSSRIVKKRQISAREYIELLESQRDPTTKLLKKFRQCFIYEKQYFMVDTFMNVEGAPSLLRIETTKEQKDLKIPPFVKVLREVTNNNKYASSTMAKLNYKMPETDKESIKKKLSSQAPASRRIS